MRAAVLVFIGAGIGGVLRHFLNLWITAIANSTFPFGIVVINVLGSAAMGLVAGWLALRIDPYPDVRWFIATGILGGFTTFSTFSLDAAMLMERGETFAAAAYVIGSVLLSILGLFIGLWCARAFG